jgi:hypothetical protein
MADTYTKLDALIGELDPYTPSQAALKKSLIDAGITGFDEEYTIADKKAVAKAAITVLRRMIVLSSDSMGKSSQGYKTEDLEKRIKDLAKENGLDVEDFVEVPSVEDGSNRW